jgi:hypothetical protein
MLKLNKPQAEFSVNIGIMKLSIRGELQDLDRKIATRALERLADHRAMRANFDVEYAGAVVASIKELRGWMQTELESLDTEAVVRHPLRIVRRACTSFISDVDAINRKVYERYEAAKTASEAGHHIYDDQASLLNAVKKFGDANLLNLPGVHINDLPTQALTWEFLFSLQRLRTSAGFAVRILEGIAQRNAPRELQRLLPEDIDDDS